MYHTLNPAAGNYAHSHSHSHHAHASSSSSSSSFARHSLTSHPPPPPPPSSTSSSSTNAANANAPAFHVPVLSQRTPAPPASLLHLTTPPNSSSSTSSFSHSHAQSQSQSHSHPHPPASMPGATTYSMPGPPPSPGLGSDDASWLTGGQDLFSGFLADDPAPGESLLTETEQKYFDMFLDWMATGTEPSHDAVEGMAAAANAAVASASRHPTPDTSLPSPAATTQGSIKSVGSGGGSQSLQQMQYVYDQQHQHHQAQPHLSPPSIHSSSFSARRHAPPPIQVQYGGGQQQHQHHQAQQHPSSASRSASFSHHTPLNGSILSPTSTYLSASDQQPLESPYLPASPTSPYPTPLTRPQHHHQQQQQPYPSQPQSHNGAATQPIQQLYALTPAGMVPVHVPTAALTAALEAQGIHTPGSGEHKLQHQPAAAATAPAHQVMYHHHPGQQQHQGQPTLVLASPPPTGTPSTGFVQPGATLLQQPQPQPQQPNVQPMLVQLVPLASPSPSNSGGMLGLPSPTYQMYTLPPPHHPQQPQPQPGVSVMGTGSAADAYATPAPSTPFGHAPHLGPAGRPRTLSTVSAMALDMGHLGLATPTAPTPRAPGAYLESPFFLHNQHGQAQQQQQQQNATVHAPSTTLSVAPPPAPPMADVRMDDAHAQDDEGQVHDFSIPAHAPTLDLVLPSPPADDPAAPQLVAKPLATRKRAGAAAAANKPSTAGAAPASRKRARASSSLADAAAEPAAVDAELKSTAAGSGKVTKRKPAAKTKASKPPAAAPMDTAIDGVPVNSHSEKRRRTLIRLGFQQLVDLVPELRETARVMAKPEAAATATGGDKVVGGHTVSKATILTKSFEYMRTVQRKIAKYGALVVQLEAYAARVGVAVPPPAEAAAAAAGEDGMDVDREQPELAHHLVAAVGGSS